MKESYQIYRSVYSLQDHLPELYNEHVPPHTAYRITCLYNELSPIHVPLHTAYRITYLYNELSQTHVPPHTAFKGSYLPV